jgi:hypothetical protein
MAYARDIYRRVETRLEPKRRSDLALRQLRALMRAYNSKVAPQVLLLGDSVMYWTIKEPDRRRLADMISDELEADVDCLTVAGAGYSSRMYMAFLSAISASRARPRVVVVQITLVTLTPPFIDHPERGCAKAAEAVRHAVATWPDAPKSYVKAGEEDWATYDRLPAPTMIAQHRTMAELDLFVNAASSSSGQRTARMRHILDSYNGEIFGPESRGIVYLTELGSVLRGMNLRSVLVISASNCELAETLLGEGARAHLERNADVVEAAFLGATGELGTVVNNVSAIEGSEFSDPLHLRQQGRLRTANGVAAAVRAHLTRWGFDESVVDGPLTV